MLLLSQGMVIITKFCFVFHLSPLGMYPFGFNWMWRLCLAFSDFFFPLRVNSNITWFYCAGDKKHCSCIVHRSHNTIHIFKNYFVIVFSVFSFSNNKFNPNGPNIVFILFYFFTQKKSLKKNASGLGWVASRVRSGRVDP